jgi:dipeptidyl aminopeptidase/acylaminoacyl peptidase
VNLRGTHAAEATRPTIARYGAWRSPIPLDPGGPEVVLLETMLDGDDLYWLEGRPAQDGHQVLVRHRTLDGSCDVSPAGANVRSRVHEYGGASYAVRGGQVFYTRFDDGRLYRIGCDGEESALTPPGGLRFADLVVDTERSRLVCVQEDHQPDRPAGGQPVNSIVAVTFTNAEAHPIVSLVTGNDFYSSPRLSPDGSRLAWVTWNHPNMPWNGTELWAGRLTPEGLIGQTIMVAGGENESVAQPEWSPDGVLHFVSDRSGWWNLYRWDESQTGKTRVVGQGAAGTVESMAPMDAELCHHQWRFGRPTYRFVAGNAIVAITRRKGQDELIRIDRSDGAWRRYDLPYTEIEFLCEGEGRVAFVAGRPTEPTAVVDLDPATGVPTVLRRASDLAVDPGYLSVPQRLEFPTERGLTAFGFFYPPVNQEYVGPQSERPPLVVRCHGGPTSNASTALDHEAQLLTSRGIAVLDVDHGGSTGYGRAYRERLDGQWGVVDVEDCANGARYLAARGLVDVERMAITGKSAGGWTALCAAAFTRVFRAAVGYFSITDLEGWAAGTHKFESRYLDRLVGPYPERRDLYVSRSPTRSPAGFSCPVLLVQGLDDRVVPPEQARLMVSALREASRPFAYVEFPDEGHGLRKRDNILRALRLELGLYARAFAIDITDVADPTALENEPGLAQLSGAEEAR